MTTTQARDGATISYRVDGSGPVTLLLLHGWAGSGGYFTWTMESLDLTRTRVLTVDMRGHGGSALGDTDNFSLDRAASDIGDVVDAVGASEVVVLGFSMGAKTAQYLATSEPDRVAGMILVAGCPVTEIPLPREILDDWYGRVGDGRALAAITEQYAARPLPEDVVEAIARDAQGISADALSGLLEECLRVSFADRIGAVRIPTLVVGGRHDQIFGPNVLREQVLNRLPHGRLAILDCGHEIPVEQPRELAAIIESFLAGNPALASPE